MTLNNAPATAERPPGLWAHCWNFLVRYRIRISLIVFALLIIEDVAEGLRPHNLTHTHDWKSMAGLGLIVVGLAIRSWAAGILHKTTQLTTVGPYALVRHPLYAGSFAMMVGFCLLIDDAENIWFVLGPFAFMYVIKILHEEQVLSQKFSDAWQQYAVRVPRFVPYRWPHNVAAYWSGRQWLGNREYNAIIATVAGLIAVQLWSTY